MNKRYSCFTKIWLRTFLALLTAFFSLNMQAQTVPAKLWDKTFGGSIEDGISTLQQTSDGGYILGGKSKSGISGDKSQACQGNYDFWEVKLDTNGNKLWDKTFGGSKDDFMTSLQQTTDGGYILGGYSDSPISGDKSQANKSVWENYWVVKLDSSGNKIWDKTFGGNIRDYLHSLHQTSDGGYILGGGSSSEISIDKSQNSEFYDYWVIKLDACGNKVWDKTLGGSGEEAIYSLQQTSDGGYILGGYSQSGIGRDKSQPSRGGWDYWMVKLDASGNKLWDRTFGGSGYDRLFSLQQTSDGGYILGGESGSNISGDKTQASKGQIDYWVVKLDASGNKLWDKTLGGSLMDWFTSLQQTSDGGYILGGYSQSGISGDKSQACQGAADFWVVKLDASGNKTWDKTITGSYNDQLYSLQQTSDGGFMLGGFSNSGIGGDKTQGSNGFTDFWVVKLAAIAPGPLVSNDVAVTAITSANSGFSLTNQETITITVKNFGTTLQSNIPVSYKINNGTLVNEVVAGPLAPNTSVSYSFTTKANLSTTGTYTIEARTNLITDALPANDIFTKVMTNYAVPTGPTITASGSLAISSGDSVALTATFSVPSAIFTWFRNGNIISGATSATYMAKTVGSYTAMATTNGCQSSISNAIVISINGVGSNLNGLNVAVYPNPSNGFFNITLPEGDNYELTVTDLTGKVIRQLYAADKNTLLAISNAAKGVYILEIIGEDKIAMRKLVVE